MSSEERLADLVFGDDIDAVARFLDGLSSVARVNAVRSLGATEEARLWELCEGRGTRLTDLVPPQVDTGVEVIHMGKNSLPLFSFFEKRFCRPADRSDVLYGYNEGRVRPLIGPGYFVAYEFAERGEVGVDYYQVPPPDASLPSHWPPVVPNEQGLQRFVFARMVDFLRKVSEHVTIGRAYKESRETSNYFVLCRTGV